MRDEVRFFLPLIKGEKSADGSSLMVMGYASTPTRDLDGEIVSLEAVRKALPSYMEWGAIREMHQAKAVGVAKEAYVDERGLYLSAKIIDPGAIRAIEEDVLKAFSIGGEKVNKTGDTITELNLIEVSLVDRPANPDCRISLAKAATEIRFFGPAEALPPPEDESWLRKAFDRVLGLLESTVEDDMRKRTFTSDARAQAAEEGAALPDGSFPIENETDLRNAIAAHGRAKDQNAAKDHIIGRAKALGLSDLLPEDWRPPPPPAPAQNGRGSHSEESHSTKSGAKDMTDSLQEQGETPTPLSDSAQNHLRKAAHHLSKAASFHARGQSHLAKAARMHHAVLKSADDGFDHKQALGHLSDANDCFGKAADHIELAHAAVGKAAADGGVAVTGYPGITDHTLADMTEGEVPWYHADAPYEEKAARVRSDMVSRSEAKLMAENAALNVKLELLSKSPGSPFKGRVTVAQHLTGGAAPTPADILLDGTEGYDPQNAQAVTKATSRAIGNMIANKSVFARNVLDPEFRGQAGTKLRG